MPNSTALAELEKAICGAVETLERLDEFALPNEQPDNAGLGRSM